MGVFNDQTIYHPTRSRFRGRCFLEKMVIGYIELSYKAGYDAGFAFGMRRGSEISSSIFTQLFQPKGRP